MSTSSPRRTDSASSAASLLRTLRETQGRSLRVVAEDLGVAPSQLSRIERGQRGLAGGLPERMAAYYGVSSDIIALADGRVPEDVLHILAAHPDELERLRAKYALIRSNDQSRDASGGADE